MGKGLLNFLICSGIITVVLLSFWQCKPESDSRTKEVRKYLKSHYDLKPDEKIDRIYVVNDRGCGNCILSLSEFIKQHVNNDRALVIINSRGMNVDLDAFEEKKKNNPNIVISHKIISDEDDLFYDSGVIYMKEGKVDTIVNLSGYELANQLLYIFKREKKR